MQNMCVLPCSNSGYWLIYVLMFVYGSSTSKLVYNYNSMYTLNVADS